MDETKDPIDQVEVTEKLALVKSGEKPLWVNFIIVAIVLLVLSSGLIYLFYSLGYFDGVTSMYDPPTPEVVENTDTNMDADEELNDQQDGEEIVGTESDEEVPANDPATSEIVERTQFNIVNEATNAVLTLSVILPEGATVVEDPLTTGTEISFPGGELSFGFPSEVGFIALTDVTELRNSDPGAVYRFMTADGDVIYASSYTSSGVCEDLYGDVPAPCTTGRLWPNILVSLTGSDGVYEIPDGIVLSVLVVE